MARRIQFRRDPKATWAAVNPTLSGGEPGFEIDTKLGKVGDGVTPWNDLKYSLIQIDLSDAPAEYDVLTFDGAVWKPQTVSNPTSAPLAVVNHRPSAATLSTTSSSLVDVDATNLAVTFTAPASGKVIVRLQAYVYMAAAANMFWNLREGSSDVGVSARVQSATAAIRVTADLVVSGLTPGASKTYKWAWRVDGSTGNLFVGPDSPGIMEVIAA
jgi:hypothetical protein